MAVIDRQQVLGKIAADDAPATLGAAERLSLRDVGDAFAPVLGRERPVGLERIRPDADARELRRFAALEDVASGGIRRIGAQVGTWPATTIERTPSRCRRRAPSTKSSR